MVQERAVRMKNTNMTRNDVDDVYDDDETDEKDREEQY